MCPTWQCRHLKCMPLDPAEGQKGCMPSSGVGLVLGGIWDLFLLSPFPLVYYSIAVAHSAFKKKTAEQAVD